MSQSPEMQLESWELTASALLDDVDCRLGQGVLFEDNSLRTRFQKELIAKHPDKYVIPGKVMEEMRYEAALAGAGYLPGDSVSSPNKMWDEVGHNEFSYPHRIGVEYDLSAQSYIATRGQLIQIIEFDYENLVGFREAGFELEYKGE